MDRYKIITVVASVRGDAQLMVLTPQRKRERVYLRKPDIDLLRSHFKVGHGKDLQGKVFTYEGKLLHSEKAILKFIDQLRKKTKAEQN